MPLPIVAAALGLGAAGAVGGFALNSAQANDRNEALAASAASRTQANEIQIRQLRSQTQQQKFELRRAAAQIEGRLEVAAAANGTGIGGTYQSLLLQNDIDLRRNLRIADQNLSRQQNFAQTGLSNDLAQLDAQTQSPVLAGLSGALNGLTTGLSLATSGGQLGVFKV